MGNNLHIYIDPELTDCGYSAYTLFENNRVEALQGSVNNAKHPRFRNGILILRLRNLFTPEIIGGQTMVDEFKLLTSDDERESYIFRTIMTNLNVHWFKYILREVHDQGYKAGIKKLQEDINNLLGR